MKENTTPIYKSKVSPLVTTLWKNLKTGRNARYRAGKFRDAAMRQLSIKSASYFYQIINGKVAMPDEDIKVLIQLANNYKHIR